MQTFGATGASVVRLKVRVARETDESALGALVIAERFGVICVVFRAEGGGAQPVVTGSAVGSRWWSVVSDRRMGPPQQGHGSRRVSGMTSAAGAGAVALSEY